MGRAVWHSEESLLRWHRAAVDCSSRELVLRGGDFPRSDGYSQWNQSRHAIEPNFASSDESGLADLRIDLFLFCRHGGGWGRKFSARHCYLKQDEVAVESTEKVPARALQEASWGMTFPFHFEKFAIQPEASIQAQLRRAYLHCQRRDRCRIVIARY